MSNVINLPRPGNHLRQRAAYQRLVAPLDARIAMDAFAAKRLAFYADPCDETEAEMLLARDAWDAAYHAAHEGAA